MSDSNKLTQDELLSQMKAQERELDRTGQAPGSAAAEADSAFGKYSTAVAQERGIRPQGLKARVPAAAEYDPQMIQQSLHEEVERVTPEGVAPTRKSVAGKVQAAAEKQDHLMERQQQQQQ